jgi:hypothetical protein
MYEPTPDSEKSRLSRERASLKRRVALDANCFIDAVTPSAHAYDAMDRILDAHSRNEITLCVSLQTLHELEQRPDSALELAGRAERLAHYSIGSWDEQVGSWADEAGTWADGKFDDERQQSMAMLAKKGTDIRDRGALIDALRGDCGFFITSDGQLSKPGPACRLEKEFPIRIRTPQHFVDEFLT